MTSRHSIPSARTPPTNREFTVRSEFASAGNSGTARLSELDRAYIGRALELAERGWGQTAPNPLVGAVVVRDGVIVGEGAHETHGGPHAEVNALTAAGERARGATLYVSLEPCSHHGKTPPCTDAILRAGVTRVVAAVAEPTASARGGAELLRAAGVPTTVGVEEDAARELNAGFFRSATVGRPWVILKLAVSLDGAIAAPPPNGTTTSRWLTGDRSRAEVHRIRAGVDAVAVGIGTVLADDPQLTVRHFRSPRTPPARVVFDRSGRTPLSSSLVRTAGEIPTIVVVEDESAPGIVGLRDAGARVLVARDIPTALDRLHELGIRSLLLEGGARIARAFLDANRVDRLVIFRAPVRLGPGAVPAFGDARTAARLESLLRAREIRTFGPDTKTVYEVTAS